MNYLDLAIDIARKNPIQKLPRMGAILVLRNGYLFTGKNQYKSHPLQAQWSRNPQSIFLHAEIDCLVKVVANDVEDLMNDGSLKTASIYVARVGKNNLPALAKPCSGCFGALIHFGIDNIRWTE